MSLPKLWADVVCSTCWTHLHKLETASLLTFWYCYHGHRLIPSIFITIVSCYCNVYSDSHQNSFPPLLCQCIRPGAKETQSQFYPPPLGPVWRSGPSGDKVHGINRYGMIPKFTASWYGTIPYLLSFRITKTVVLHTCRTFTYRSVADVCGRLVFDSRFRGICQKRWLGFSIVPMTM